MKDRLIQPIQLRKDILEKLKHNPIDTSRLRPSGSVALSRRQVEAKPSSMIPLAHELTRAQRVAALGEDKQIRRKLHLDPKKAAPRPTTALPPLPDKPRVWHNPARQVDAEYEIGLLRQEIEERTNDIIAKHSGTQWHDARKQAAQHFYDNRINIFPELVEVANRNNLLPEYKTWRKISNFLQDTFNDALNTACMRNVMGALGHMEATSGMPSSTYLVSREDADTINIERALFRPKPKDDVER